MSCPPFFILVRLTRERASSGRLGRLANLMRACDAMRRPIGSIFSVHRIIFSGDGIRPLCRKAGFIRGFPVFFRIFFAIPGGHTCHPVALAPRTAEHEQLRYRHPALPHPDHAQPAAESCDPRRRRPVHVQGLRARSRAVLAVVPAGPAQRAASSRSRPADCSRRRCRSACGRSTTRSCTCTFRPRSCARRRCRRGVRFRATTRCCGWRSRPASS